MVYRIDFEQVEKFWNWLRSGYPKDAYTEIKLMSIQNPLVYEHVVDFSKQNPDIIVRKNCQFFIKDFRHLFLIL